VDLALNGSVVLVTGGARGVGLGITRAFLSAGATVVICGRHEPPEPTGAEFLPCDVRDPDQVDALVTTITSRFGRLDVLVNNAGVIGEAATNAANAPLDDAHRTMETNLFGAWRLTQALLPLLRQSPRARIVNVSSGAGQLSEMNGGNPGYRISKSALNALTRILSNEEPTVLVNSMCPGWVRTDMGGAGATRSVEEGADTAVWLATIPDDGPTGGFFRNREPIPW
jgi:NAD(P)-dependent dehydrogenase (short-subunit alcohol dehydrogenase family)